MGKGLNEIFKNVVKDISKDLPPLGESGSEVSHFILEPIKFAEVTKLSDDIKKFLLKETQKDIKNLINNQTSIFEYKKKGEPVNLCMDLYKAKI